MKTFIYLSLIAILILTGCKSNSFTTQRYTKFGHASHKKHVQEPVVKTNKTQLAEVRPETEIVKESKTPVTLITAGITTLKEALIKPERKVYNLNSPEAIDNSTSTTYTHDETIDQNSKQTFKSKTTYKEKTTKKEGFIDSAFMAALWIVLVVIFICLIIFLLAAVF